MKAKGFYLHMVGILGVVNPKLKAKEFYLYMVGILCVVNPGESERVLFVHGRDSRCS